MKSTPSLQKGFTLIETLLAMVILTMAVVMLASSWGGNYARMRRTQLKTEVIALLQRKMVEIDMEYKGKPLSSIPEDGKEDDFGSEYPQYRWRMTAKDLDIPDFTSLLTGREGGANLMLIQVMQQMKDHLSKSVKEVQVTVIYTPEGGGEPIEHSVTTYYVDYDKQIPIPGAGG
jgi:general secretion pathway protein I